MKKTVLILGITLFLAHHLDGAQKALAAVKKAHLSYITTHQELAAVRTHLALLTQARNAINCLEAKTSAHGAPKKYYCHIYFAPLTEIIPL